METENLVFLYIDMKLFPIVISEGDICFNQTWFEWNAPIDSEVRSKTKDKKFIGNKIRFPK